MIDQIPWPRPARGEAQSPFARGREERPLRLTFHVSSFQGLNDAEAEALSVLEDQVRVADIEALRVVVGEEAARALAVGIEEREAPLDPATVPVAPGSVAELVDPAVLGPMPLPRIDIRTVPIAADFTRGYLFLTDVPAAYEPVKTRPADAKSQRGVMSTVIFHPDQLKALVLVSQSRPFVSGLKPLKRWRLSHG